LTERIRRHGTLERLPRSFHPADTIDSIQHPFPMKSFVLFLLSAFLLNAKAAEKPNILVLFCDDLGYADTGFHGSKEAVTPHLDRLARSGVTCTDGYVSYPVCSPSRAGLLTGRYQSRFGHENNPVYDPLDPLEGLPLTEKLLPQLLKEAGYRTGWIGKWHLGASPAHVPWKRGFDECYGFIGGGHRFLDWKPNERQYTLPLTRNGKEIPDVPTHLTTALGEESAAFIQRNAKQPWMLFLAFNAPHTPHEPTPERLARFSGVENAQRRRYLAQVSLLDDAVGTVLDTLEQSGQTNRTLVFFLSDNGGPITLGPNNGRLRDGKGSLYEGGTRVPFLVSWPGTLPQGTKYGQPVISLDIFATALALAGKEMPRDTKYDGVNLIPHLKGEKTAPPHDRLFWRMLKKGSRTVREGQWKLMVTPAGETELYDLASDLGESKNMAGVRPEIATRLKAALDAWTSELATEAAFPGSSVKNEDWGPGGANQKAKVKPGRR
jgi:arylsulfatase A-like enzyme